MAAEGAIPAEVVDPTSAAGPRILAAVRIPAVPADTIPIRTRAPDPAIPMAAPPTAIPMPDRAILTVGLPSGIPIPGPADRHSAIRIRVRRGNPALAGRIRPWAVPTPLAALATTEQADLVPSLPAAYGPKSTAAATRESAATITVQALTTRRPAEAMATGLAEATTEGAAIELATSSEAMVASGAADGALDTGATAAGDLLLGSLEPISLIRG